MDVMDRRTDSRNEAVKTSHDYEERVRSSLLKNANPTNL